MRKEVIKRKLKLKDLENKLTVEMVSSNSKVSFQKTKIFADQLCKN